jgi:hypothetical protein
MSTKVAFFAERFEVCALGIGADKRIDVNIEDVRFERNLGTRRLLLTANYIPSGHAIGEASLPSELRGGWSFQLRSSSRI